MSRLSHHVQSVGLVSSLRAELEELRAQHSLLVAQHEQLQRDFESVQRVAREDQAWARRLLKRLQRSQAEALDSTLDAGRSGVRPRACAPKCSVLTRVHMRVLCDSAIRFRGARTS